MGLCDRGQPGVDSDAGESDGDDPSERGGCGDDGNASRLCGDASNGGCEPALGQPGKAGGVERDEDRGHDHGKGVLENEGDSFSEKGRSVDHSVEGHSECEGGQILATEVRVASGVDDVGAGQEFCEVMDAIEPDSAPQIDGLVDAEADVEGDSASGSHGIVGSAVQHDGVETQDPDNSYTEELVSCGDAGLGIGGKDRIVGDASASASGEVFGERDDVAVRQGEPGTEEYLSFSKLEPLAVDADHNRPHVKRKQASSADEVAPVGCEANDSCSRLAGKESEADDGVGSFGAPCSKVAVEASDSVGERLCDGEESSESIRKDISMSIPPGSLSRAPVSSISEGADGDVMDSKASKSGERVDEGRNDSGKDHGQGRGQDLLGRAVPNGTSASDTEMHHESSSPATGKISDSFGSTSQTCSLKTSCFAGVPNTSAVNSEHKLTSQIGVAGGTSDLGENKERRERDEVDVDGGGSGSRATVLKADDSGLNRGLKHGLEHLVKHELQLDSKTETGICPRREAGRDALRETRCNLKQEVGRDLSREAKREPRREAEHGLRWRSERYPQRGVKLELRENEQRERRREKAPLSRRRPECDSKQLPKRGSGREQEYDRRRQSGRDSGQHRYLDPRRERGRDREGNLERWPQRATERNSERERNREREVDRSGDPMNWERLGDRDRSRALHTRELSSNPGRDDRRSNGRFPRGTRQPESGDHAENDVRDRQQVQPSSSRSSREDSCRGGPGRGKPSRNTHEVRGGSGSRHDMSRERVGSSRAVGSRLHYLETRGSLGKDSVEGEGRDRRPPKSSRDQSDRSDRSASGDRSHGRRSEVGSDSCVGESRRKRPRHSDRDFEISGDRPSSPRVRLMSRAGTRRGDVDKGQEVIDNSRSDSRLSVDGGKRQRSSSQAKKGVEVSRSVSSKGRDSVNRPRQKHNSCAGSMMSDVNPEETHPRALGDGAGGEESAPRGDRGAVAADVDFGFGRENGSGDNTPIRVGSEVVKIEMESDTGGDDVHAGPENEGGGSGDRSAEDDGHVVGTSSEGTKLKSEDHGQEEVVNNEGLTGFPELDAKRDCNSNGNADHPMKGEAGDLAGSDSGSGGIVNRLAGDDIGQGAHKVSKTAVTSTSPKSELREDADGASQGVGVDGWDERAEGLELRGCCGDDDDDGLHDSCDDDLEDGEIVIPTTSEDPATSSPPLSSIHGESDRCGAVGHRERWEAGNRRLDRDREGLSRREKARHHSAGTRIKEARREIRDNRLALQRKSLPGSSPANSKYGHTSERSAVRPGTLAGVRAREPSWARGSDRSRGRSQERRRKHLSSRGTRGTSEQARAYRSWDDEVFRREREREPSRSCAKHRTSDQSGLRPGLGFAGKPGSRENGKRGDVDREQGASGDGSVQQNGFREFHSNKETAKFKDRAEEQLDEGMCLQKDDKSAIKRKIRSSCSSHDEGEGDRGANREDLGVKRAKLESSDRRCQAYDDDCREHERDGGQSKRDGYLRRRPHRRCRESLNPRLTERDVSPDGPLASPSRDHPNRREQGVRLNSDERMPLSDMSDLDGSEEGELVLSRAGDGHEHGSRRDQEDRKPGSGVDRGRRIDNRGHPAGSSSKFPRTLRDFPHSTSRCRRDVDHRDSTRSIGGSRCSRDKHEDEAVTSGGKSWDRRPNRFGRRLSSSCRPRGSPRRRSRDAKLCSDGDSQGHLGNGGDRMDRSSSEEGAVRGSQRGKGGVNRDVVDGHHTPKSVASAEGYSDSYFHGERLGDSVIRDRNGLLRFPPSSTGLDSLPECSRVGAVEAGSSPTMAWLSSDMAGGSPYGTPSKLPMHSEVAYTMEQAAAAQLCQWPVYGETSAAHSRQHEDGKFDDGDHPGKQRGAKEAGEGDENGTVLPWHMLGRAPDFKAKGGGISGDLKFASHREEDEHRLFQRQKQIDYGKNTRGYDMYTLKVPRFRRRQGDPITPDIGIKCSKREFDWRIRTWRRGLHRWDDDPHAHESLSSGDSDDGDTLSSTGRNGAPGCKAGSGDAANILPPGASSPRAPSESPSTPTRCNAAETSAGNPVPSADQKDNSDGPVAKDSEMVALSPGRDGSTELGTPESDNRRDDHAGTKGAPNSEAGTVTTTAATAFSADIYAENDDDAGDDPFSVAPQASSLEDRGVVVSVTAAEAGGSEPVGGDVGGVDQATASTDAMKDSGASGTSGNRWTSAALYYGLSEEEDADDFDVKDDLSDAGEGSAYGSRRHRRWQSRRRKRGSSAGSDSEVDGLASSGPDEVVVDDGTEYHPEGSSGLANAEHDAPGGGDSEGSSAGSLDDDAKEESVSWSDSAKGAKVDPSHTAYVKGDGHQPFELKGIGQPLRFSGGGSTGWGQGMLSASTHVADTGAARENGEQSTPSSDLATGETHKGSKRMEDSGAPGEDLAAIAAETSDDQAIECFSDDELL